MVIARKEYVDVVKIDDAPTKEKANYSYNFKEEYSNLFYDFEQNLKSLQKSKTPQYIDGFRGELMRKFKHMYKGIDYV
jgi:hypothetical protein